MDRKQAMLGCLLGTAVGDAIGLPREGLSPRRARMRFGDRPLEHRLLFGRGMCSDDTEHACMTAQAALASRGDPPAFARALAWRLRWWLVGLPAGIGFATLRATLKLWAGVSPQRSGVLSAGNGPAMRAAVLGLYAEDERHLRELVRASTRLTHTDSRAEEGAMAVALAARTGFHRGPRGLAMRELIELLQPYIAGEELIARLRAIIEFLDRGASAVDFATHLGQQKGVSGYINNTVPIAIYCWLRYPDFREAVEECICLGGDTDTTGAIVGALAGATLGPDAIPASWRSGLWEFPRSAAWITGLADRLASTSDAAPAAPYPLFWPALAPRNALFAGIVLTHGFRRLAPPY